MRELHDLRGYRDKIDPSQEPLKNVIGTTHFPELVQCGLGSCRAWHLYGYVVELEHGVTNVGHICGGQFGQALFDSKLADYQERRLRPHLVEKIVAGRQLIEAQGRHIESQAQRLHELLVCRINFKRVFPRLSTALDRRANGGDATIKDVIERTKSEIDALMALTPGVSRESVRYREVSRGRLSGLTFFIADLPALIAVRNQAEQLRDIRSLHASPIDTLLGWERWLDLLPHRVQEASQLIKAADAFLSPSNVELLRRIATDPSEHKQLTVSAVEGLFVEPFTVMSSPGADASAPDVGRRRKGWAR